MSNEITPQQQRRRRLYNGSPKTLQDDVYVSFQIYFYLV